jgi:undecaprenyl-diphosphatase
MNSTILLFAQKLDLDVINFISNHTTPFGIKLAIFVSTIGSPQSFLLMTIVVCLSFWLHKKPYHLIQFLVTLGVGSLVVYLIKIFIARVRPLEAIISSSGYSFPSGHATIATLFCFIIIFAYKDHIKNYFLKFIFILFFSLAALSISFSRVYLSVHYLSDVVVGILLGLLISSISVFIFENFFKRESLI